MQTPESRRRHSRLMNSATSLVPYTHLHCARAGSPSLSPGLHRSRVAFRSRGGGPWSGGDAAATPHAPTPRQCRRQRRRWRQWQRQRQSRRGSALVHAKRQLPRCLLQRPCRLRCIAAPAPVSPPVPAPIAHAPPASAQPIETALHAEGVQMAVQERGPSRRCRQPGGAASATSPPSTWT